MPSLLLGKKRLEGQTAKQALFMCNAVFFKAVFR